MWKLLPPLRSVRNGLSLALFIGFGQVSDAGTVARESCSQLAPSRMRVLRSKIQPHDNTFKIVAPNGFILSFNDAVELKGEMAGCVERYVNSYILLQDGRVFKHDSAGYISKIEIDRSPFFKRFEQTGPVWMKSRPISVTGLSSSEFNHQRIGIWIGNGGGLIAMFEAGKHTGGRPTALAFSKINLYGIGYSPYLDIPEGDLTVLHRISSKNVRVFIGRLRVPPATL